MGAVRIIFEDDHLLVVDKPAGQAVHRGEGHEGDNLVDVLRARLAGAGVAGADALSPIHRLDAATSGLVALGRGARVIRAVQAAHGEGAVHREYLALVQGVAHRKGVVRVHLTRQGATRNIPHGAQQEAETRYRRLLYTRAATLLRVRPQTGRPHQIRRHLRSIGHPIAGDTRWGDMRFNYWMADHHDLHRLFLHAAHLSFLHPVTGETLALDAPLPDELINVLDSLGFPALLPEEQEAEGGAATAPAHQDPGD